MVPGLAVTQPLPNVKRGISVPAVVARNVEPTHIQRRVPTAVRVVPQVNIQQPGLAVVRRVRQRVNTGTAAAVPAVRRDITVLVTGVGMHVRPDLLLLPVRLAVLVTVVPVTGII